MPDLVAEVVDLEAVRRRRGARTPEERALALAARDDRRKARTKIVQAANRLRVGRARYVRSRVHRGVEAPRLLSMRHLQLAVAVCRHHGLVDDATLTAAGFRPVKPEQQPEQKPVTLKAAA